MILDGQGYEWHAMKDRSPPFETTVMTGNYDPKKKIFANQRPLILSRRLWFLPDMSAFIFDRPSHWRLISTKKKKPLEEGLPELPMLPPDPQSETVPAEETT